MKSEDPSKIEEGNMNFLKLSRDIISFQPLAFFAIVFTYVLFFSVPLGISLLLREIFNTITGIPEFDFSIWTLILIIPLAYLIRAGMGVFSVISEFIFVLSIEALLRTNLINGVFDKPGSDSLPGSSGESISRFRGDAAEIGWFYMFISFNTAFLIFGVVATMIMVSISPMITLYTYIPLIMVVFIVISLRGKLTEYRKAARKSAGKVTGSIAEIFNSVQAIKVANAEENVFNHFRHINEERRRAVVKDRTFSRILRSLNETVSSYSAGLLLLLIASLIQDGSFTIGDYVLFTALFGWISEFSITIGELISWYVRARVSYDRMYNVIRSDHKKVPDTNISKHREIYIKKDYPEILPIPSIGNDNKLLSLEIHELSYKYRDSDNGIDNISFTIPAGSFNVITGQIGSGKSTLLKTIIGLLPKNSGEIRWNGTSIADAAEFFTPPVSSYTSQVPKLFSDSIEDNIMLGLPEDTERMASSINMAVLNDDLRNLEGNLETIIGPKGIKLSGGQKQRLAAARMFFRDAEIYVVDDLSSALDVETEKQMWEQIFANNQATFLVVSHRKSVLQQADQIILLSGGSIAAKGKLKELLETEEEMREICDKQETEEIVVKERSEN